MIHVHGTFVHVYLLEHKSTMLLVYTVSEGRLGEEGLECVSGHCKNGFVRKSCGVAGVGGVHTVHCFFCLFPPPLSFFLFPFFFPSKEGCLFFHFNLQVINFSRTYLMETRWKKKTWKQTINNYVNHCTWEQLNSSACFRLFLLFSFSFFLFPINQVLWFAVVVWVDSLICLGCVQIFQRCISYIIFIVISFSFEGWLFVG